MTTADEARFIALWQAGTETAEIGRQFGIPRGTLSFPAHTLLRQSKLQLRPKGGPFPRQRAQGRDSSSTLVQRPVQSLDTGVVQTLDTLPVQRLDRLEDEVQGLRRIVQSVVDRLDHLTGAAPEQITALPPYPPGKALRWNLWILDALRDEPSTFATERGISTSQLVQEFLWEALTERQ
jgi:hypothetical protein